MREFIYGRAGTKATEQTKSALRGLGYRWTIETPVDYRIELHNEIELLNGKTIVRFVAELDNYGNVTEWGDDDVFTRKLSSSVLNADGDEIVGHHGETV